ncbi:kinase-like protein [Clathrospora elynae]|uniref:non-specific serine/threonine protein kinase n=1 Tax=Clathrospora elynae TaxID=706981 RepID=A0A6A5T4I8_9PLEO|nr:kinase-like protein [Clathrospora elynae]
MLAKLNFIDTNADTSEAYLGRSATQSAKTNVRASTYRERYVPVRHLGTGGNGEVDLCRDTRIGTLVAVKTIYHDNPRSLPNEVSILQQLGRHDNLVWYHTMLHHPTRDLRLQLVFEYCPMGDLVDYLETFETQPPEMFIWHVFKHVAKGLNFLHRRGVVHGDIKPANILLTTHRSGELYPLPKIADLGTACINPPHDIPQSHLGTLGFQAPESALRYGPAADIWALGCVIHELALGYLPLQRLEKPENVNPEMWFEMSGMPIPRGTSHHRIYKEFCFFMAFHPPSRVRIDHPSPLTSTSYSKLLNYLMMRALDMNPHTRITAHELCRIIPELEPLVYGLLVLGREALLEQFDERRDTEWGDVVYVTDSQVLRQIFDGLAERANQEWDMGMLQWATCLLQLMRPEDQVAAYRFVADMGICGAS